MSIQPITFVTFPRSGSTWLKWNMHKNTNLDAYFIHYNDIFKNADIMAYPIVTTVRNPIDCISSLSVMQEPVGIPAIPWIKYYNREYIDHYEFILKNAKMLFSFDDVINNTDNVVKHLCDEFNGNFVSSQMKFEEYEQWHDDTKIHDNKLVTSKNEKNYDSAKEYLSTLELSRHWELYNEALSKCIKLPI